MKIAKVSAIVLGLSVLAAGYWYSTLDRETRGLLAAMPTNSDVLSWNQAQREAAFRAMDRMPILAQIGRAHV